MKALFQRKSPLAVPLPDPNDFPMRICGKWWVMILVGAGILVRVGFFIADSNLWRDEAKYLMALEQTNYSDIVLEMILGQRGALAPGVMLKFMIEWGWGEWVRLPFLIFGSLALVGFARLVRICFSDSMLTQAFAVGVFAFAPQLILFSNQSKGYGIDVWVSVFLLNVAADIFRFPHRSKLLWAFPWVAVASVMLSMPSVFVLVSIACLALMSGNQRQRCMIWLSTLLAGIVFFVLYLSRDSGFHYLPEYWNDVGKYASWNPKWWIEAGFISIYSPVIFPSFRYELIPMGAVFCILAGMGLWSFAGKQNCWKWIILCCGPIACCAIAAVIRQYPLAARLILFSAPCVILLVSYGMDHVRLKLGKFVMIPTSVLLLSTLLILSLFEFLRPQAGLLDDWRLIKAELRPSDVILTDLFQAQVLEYYRHVGMMNPGKVVHEWSDESNLQGKPPLEEVVNQLPAQSRIWLTAAAIDYHRSHTQELRAEVEEMRLLLSGQRQMLSEYRRARSTLMLFGPILDEAQRNAPDSNVHD